MKKCFWTNWQALLGHSGASQWGRWLGTGMPQSVAGPSRACRRPWSAERFSNPSKHPRVSGRSGPHNYSLRRGARDCSGGVPPFCEACGLCAGLLKVAESPWRRCIPRPRTLYTELESLRFGPEGGDDSQLYNRWGSAGLWMAFF